MAEFIERDKFRNILEAKAEMAMGTPKQVFYNTIAMLDLIPAADVVEVVRCKDCRLHETIECFADDIHSVRDNDFCSWGECGAKMDGERGKDR